MNVKPKIGLDKLIFGMKESEVIKLLGIPDESFNEKDNEHRRIITYNNKKLRLTFYENEDGKLGYIESSNIGLSYEEKLIIGVNTNQVIDNVFWNLETAWDISKHHSFNTYFSEKLWITLTEEYNEIVSFEIGVTFKDDENYNWP